MLDNLYMDEIIKRVLKEDMPMGDITTDNLIERDSVSRGHIIAKEQGVIAGLDMAERVFKVLDASVNFTRLVKDGDKVKKGEIIAEIKGNTRALLKGERTALDFLQRLSGIATKTSEFCEIVREFPVKISDTRKTTPGLRLLEKSAVRTGGGHNHRFSLSDGVLIKDNHIKAAGSIKKAVQLSRQKIPHTIKIEVETETLEQVREALECGADIIMLDNMSVDMMKEAVRIVDKKALVEASGNVNLEKVYEIASIGVDIISVGGLTHSAKALDMSLKFI
jgi:nicotinate-nucleotide pyrophosphorylase (carboxylating)